MNAIEKTTGLLYSIKRPAPEIRLYSVDFKKLTNNSVISAITSITIAKRNLVTEITPLTVSNQIISNTIVLFNLAGGTDGEDYEITITVEISPTNIVSEDILIKVRKAGLIWKIL